MADAHLDRVRTQFARQADAYARMAQTRDERALEALVAIAGTRPEHRVLDVACGPGFLTLAFAARCAEAVGVDATPEWRERAQAEAARRGLENVRFETGDAEALRFDAGTFDRVACRAAFHHFPRPERVLAEMKRVARPEGRLLLADMLGSDDPSRATLHDRIERLCDPTHVRALPPAEFARLFAEAGLEPEREIPSSIDYDAEEWMAHGGPGEGTAREIVALLEGAIEGDRAGLRVRREDGRLRFTHRVAVFLLRPRA
jgi:ubiquinone/menaquinone biosynthesis C-methylase UbiE